MKNICFGLVFSFVLAAAANASVVTYATSLSGAAESPSNASAGTGFASVTYDSVLHTLLVNVTFSGLSTPNTASHIHCCTAAPGTGTAGVATSTPTFIGFPAGVTAGTYTHLFDLTQAASWNPAFITAEGGTTAGAEAAFAAGIAAGETYLNIHTTNFPSGEIRGFLVPVPEPGTALLFAPILAAAMWLRRSRGRRA